MHFGMLYPAVYSDVTAPTGQSVLSLGDVLGLC